VESARHKDYHTYPTTVRFGFPVPKGRTFGNLHVTVATTGKGKVTADLQTNFGAADDELQVSVHLTVDTAGRTTTANLDFSESRARGGYAQSQGVPGISISNGGFVAVVVRNTGYLPVVVSVTMSPIRVAENP
jgi:hypothetical protein